MKEQLWESIKLMLWAWTMGRGEKLPEGFREVLDKVEELLEEAAEGEKTQADAADAPLWPETEGEKPEKPARFRHFAFMVKSYWSVESPFGMVKRSREERSVEVTSARMPYFFRLTP